MAEELRVGLVGGGPWAQHVHAPGIVAHPEFELVGVWTRRSEAAAELAAANGAMPFEDVSALVDAVDVVAISVPPAVQPDIAVAVAQAGRHLILEKPLATSTAEADRLATEVVRAGVANIVFLTFRFATETRQWLADIAAGGPWSGGTARWLSGGLLGGEFAGSPWRQENGSILDIGPHLFDLLDAALGPISEVRAATFSEPDLWHVIFEHGGRATSTATISMRLAIDPSVLEFDVYGSRGRRVLVARQTSSAHCYASLLDELAVMIRSGETHHSCDVRRGAHLQWIIDQARQRAG